MIFLTDRIGFSKRTITDEGYLVVKDARIARTGIQEYRAFELGDMFSDRDPLDIIRVYRPEEEVFKQESMDSFANKPVTNNHPEVPVTAENFKDLAVGFSGDNIRQDGMFLVADLRVTDLAAVEDVEAGKRELSNGYKSSITRGEGTNSAGETFDAIQRDILGNHIAIVDAARCGTQCSISDNQPKKVNTMKIMINGVPFEIADEAAAAAVQNLVDENTTLKATMTSDAATVLATHDAALAVKDEEAQALQAKLDDAKANEMTPEKLDTILDERMEISVHAKSFVKDFSAKGKTCMAIKREVLVAKFKDSISAEKLANDTYVSARFDALVESTDSKGNGKTGVDQLAADSANGGKVTDIGDAEEARRRKIIGNKIAHRFPPGARAKHSSDFTDAVDKEYQKQYGAK